MVGKNPFQSERFVEHWIRVSCHRAIDRSIHLSIHNKIIIGASSIHRADRSHRGVAVAADISVVDPRAMVFPSRISSSMDPGMDVGVVPQLVVLKDGAVIDNVLLHGKETFVLGRHQNCDVVAGHASISRHHLEIRVIPGSRELLLTDMHSVHGTRLDGEPLLPLEPAAMKEDSKFEVGASTRTYVVKWIPVEQSDSSSSSCTSSTSFAKGLEEEFQSALKLDNAQSRNPLQDRGAKKQPERIAFADLINRSGSPKKPAVPRSPSILRKSHSLRTSPAAKKTNSGVSKIDQSPSKLWLRRGVSMELPSLVTAAPPPPPPAAAAPPPSSHAPSAPPFEISVGEACEDNGYFSDKENVAPAAPPKPAESSRQPFKPLFFLPSPSVSDYKPVLYYGSSEEESHSIKDHSSTATAIVRRPRIAEKIDEIKKKQWHIVVDTNCFVDDESFNSLKKLEGVRETRVIVPKIVVRELDFLKRKEFECRRSLRWIEDCMVKMPWWIHVQRSTETRPVRSTPPVSPSLGLNMLPYAADLLSPTNDDHVLDCALLFQRSVVEGRVVLLTNDTALKIKAMAEGLVAEGSTSFCDSLLNPYSKRFLWAGSTVCRSPVISPLGRSNRSGSAYSSGKNGGGGGGGSKLEALDEHPRGLQVVL